MYHIFIIHSSVDGHLHWFYFLNSRDVQMSARRWWVHTQKWYRWGIRTSFLAFWEISTLIPIVTAQFYTSTNRKISLYPQPHRNLSLYFLHDGHSHHHEMEIQSSFNLPFSDGYVCWTLIRYLLSMFFWELFVQLIGPLYWLSMLKIRCFEEWEQHICTPHRPNLDQGRWLRGWSLLGVQILSTDGKSKNHDISLQHQCCWGYRWLLGAYWPTNLA